jgi:hypothetical protein
MLAPILRPGLALPDSAAPMLALGCATLVGAAVGTLMRHPLLGAAFGFSLVLSWIVWQFLNFHG